MFGKNPKRPPVQSDGLKLDVQEVFATLQGEGPYVGWPSVFVRLGGCNLACEFCDTEFESYQSVALEALIADIEHKANGLRNLIVITGGEPFRQNIEPLCTMLIQMGFHVQIETNGTLHRELPEAVDIICSPKVTGGKYHAVREDVLPRVSAFKFIIADEDSPYRDVAEVGQSKFGTPVYVQPMDQYDPEKNKRNIARAEQLAQTRGYRLSLQMHKILGIP
ncbi:MAG: 7-carboxy-7-deazaguanine synthase QueE [Rickettsiales bacterium]